MTDAKKAAKPLPRLILTTPEHLVAFGFGAGLAPFAPGTFGTIVGIPFFLVLMWLPTLYYAIAVLSLFVLGCWMCGRSAKLLGVHDFGGIVFDEIVGFLVACAPLLPALALRDGHLWRWLAAAFLAFRFFDIVKPWPIRTLDRKVHGGFGIMVDDLLAGVYAGALIAVATVLVPKE
jgi:phosphatidylglycerophosphatase A